MAFIEGPNTHMESVELRGEHGEHSTLNVAIAVVPATDETHISGTSYWIHVGAIGANKMVPDLLTFDGLYLRMSLDAEVDGLRYRGLTEVRLEQERAAHYTLDQWTREAMTAFSVAAVTWAA